MICPKCGHEFESDSKRGQAQKEGMIKRFVEGKHMSRAPFGYEWDLRNKVLIPTSFSDEVREIFEEFLHPEMNLSKLAKKHNLSVNGLKKILSNFAYVGKIKFDGQIQEGKHKPLLSTILFNHVQDKLDKISRKNS